jgi:hypothetical protein
MNDEYVEPHTAVVKTTKTPSGRLLDWIPIESQVVGGKNSYSSAIVSNESFGFSSDH